MDQDKHVSRGNEPPRLLEGKQYIVIDRVPEHVITRERNGEITNRDDNIRENHPLPHRLLRRLLRSGRNRSLDLQHDVVPGVSKRDISKGIKEIKHVGRRGLTPQAIVDVLLHALGERRGPRNGRVG